MNLGVKIHPVSLNLSILSINYIYLYKPIGINMTQSQRKSKEIGSLAARLDVLHHEERGVLDFFSNCCGYNLAVFSLHTKRRLSN